MSHTITPTAKPTSRQGQIEHILQQLSHEQLATFVREKALHDTDFRDTLLICFSDLLSSDEPAEPKYRQMLSDMVQRHANSDGYINIASAQRLTDAVHKLLDTARKATTPTRETIDLCLAVITTLPRMIEQMEDSDNQAYQLMRTACTTLWECSSMLTEERQQQLFERVVQEYGNPLYVELDLDSSLLSLLKDWARDKPTRQAACLRQLENLLKVTKGDHWRKNYLLEQTNALIAFWRR
ncbi:MAG: hypothetical protein RI964_205 [Pseudomonadota bacterium]|jgi:hypothetical protein